MEKHSLAASFNGSLYQRPITFHQGEPLDPSYLRSETPRTTAAGPGDHRIVRRVDDTELNIFDAQRYFSKENDAAKQTDGVAERCDLSINPSASSVSSVDHLGRRDSRSEATASSEASWNSRSGLLSSPPGSVAVAVRAFPLREPKRPSSSHARRFFSRSCPCSGKKSVDVEERQSESKNSIGSPSESNAASFSAKKQSFGAGEVGLSSIPERAATEELKNEFDNVEEMTKVKITPGTRGKDSSVFNIATRFSPEKTFPAEIGHRIVNSGGPFTNSAGFSFPNLNPPSSNLAEEPPRDSLEVYRPAEESTKIVRRSTEFPRRATVLPYPGSGDRPTFTCPASPNRRPEEDAASDASSDLFEIESLSTQFTYRRRDSLDELEGRRFVGSGAAAEILQISRSLEGAGPPPSISPSECYPPSEVSVAWSVTTAEGFDRATAANLSSAASNFDEFRFIEEEHDRFATAIVGARKKLLSCRCEKAVSVGPNPVRIGPEVEPDVMPRIAKLASANLVQGRPVWTG